MKRVATQEVNGQPPIKKDGERVYDKGKGGAEDHTCDDPSNPRVSRGGVRGLNDHLDTAIGMGSKERRGSMNGEPTTSKQMCKDKPARPRGRAPKYCPVCHKRIGRIVIICAGCGKPMSMVLSDKRLIGNSPCCSWECRRAAGLTKKTKKFPSWPRARIADRADYGERLMRYRLDNKLSADALGARCDVPATSIYRVESGQCGLCEAYYNRIGNATGVW